MRNHKFISLLPILLCLCLTFGCSITGRLRRRQSNVGLAQLTRIERQRQQPEFRPQEMKIEHDSNTFYLVPVDTLDDGERVASLAIEQITVVAKVRSIPERRGKVTLDFVVSIPKGMLGRSRSVVVTPFLHKFGQAQPLEDLVIRGGRFSLLQERDYWQYEKYCWLYDPDSIRAEQMFSRLVKFPYPEDARLDSLIEHSGMMTYYYSQDVPTDETSKQLSITLQGKVLGIDDSAYSLPQSDTLTYLVSSMLSFIDTVPRYRIRVIDKYVTVNDRHYIRFRVGDSRLVDTLGDNRRQLDRIDERMRQIVGQQEFYVDSILLTAAASPEGNYAANNRLARERAQSIRRYLLRRHGHRIDSMLTVRWVAEDWQELASRIDRDERIVNRNKILGMIADRENPDRREANIKRLFPQDYAYLKKNVYPWLRAVSIRYDLRRIGMVKDTIHTTEPDTTYAQGVALLQKRRYAQALYILADYKDRNTVVTYLSLGHDRQALELLESLPKDAVTEYLSAIACSRLGNKHEGREHFLEACRLDPRMEFRGNLDPEISELLKTR